MDSLKDLQIRAQIFCVHYSTNWPRSRFCTVKTIRLKLPVVGNRGSLLDVILHAGLNILSQLSSPARNISPTLPSSFNDILETCLYHPSNCILLHVFHPFFAHCCYLFTKIKVFLLRLILSSLTFLAPFFSTFLRNQTDHF
jgi:hypothetical protein